MKTNTSFKIIALTLFLFSLKSFGETRQDVAQEDSTAIHIERVRELVSYLEFALNTLGDAYTPSREKDIIITTSYSKFFRDENVQVEDDLALTRSTVTNKDVQAYLKDVEFFFRHVSFKLDIEEIQPMVNDSSQLFYLVKMNRNLNGISVLNDTINESITRYLEVNYYEERNDLKIVSFYTTKLSEKEDLMNWWEQLSFEWKYIFQQRFNYYDSVGYEELKVLIELDSLDLSSNRYISDFNPLFKLNQLTYLNLSNTSIDDLTPLRVHNKIKYLDISDTKIDTIDHIKYASEITHLNLSGSNIADLSTLEYFPKLEYLNLNNCVIDSIEFSSDFQNLTHLDLSYFNSDSYGWLFRMPQLQYLDASYSNINDLNQLSNNSSLKILSLAGTGITDLKPLQGLTNLEELNLESMDIQSLDEVSGMSSLQKIYCDNSNITNDEANDFMNLNPYTLVIFESDKLQEWWDNLEHSLQSAFAEKFNLGMQPRIDDLAGIIKTDSLDLSGLKTTDTLPDLWPFMNLIYLDIHDTFISDIGSITQVPNLTYLNANSSNISSIDSLQELKDLNFIDLATTRVSSIEGLTGLRSLKYLNVDDAQVETEDILKFIESNPGCLVIYRSVYLVNWWEGLSEEWHNVFEENAGLDNNQIDERSLHIISYLESVKIDSADIRDLHPLDELYYLKQLEINHVSINDISRLQNHKDLTYLTVSASPVTDFNPVTSLKQLKQLDISNTGIDDLSFTVELKALESLKVSGTKVKSLKPLKELTHLKELDISNTNIKSLKVLNRMANLELVVCYNTDLKSKVIEGFKADNPNCKVLFY
jgi:Leucine-rich repeat (LRR) protein